MVVEILYVENSCKLVACTCALLWAGIDYQLSEAQPQRTVIFYQPASHLWPLNAMHDD